MRNNIEENFNAIKKLIEREEDKAIKIFRESNFNSRLYNRIAREFKKESFSIFKLMKSFSPIALLFLLFTVVILAIFIIPSFFKPKLEVNPIEKFFQQASIFQESMTKEPLPLRDNVILFPGKNFRENMLNSCEDLYFSLIELFSNLQIFSESDYFEKKDSIKLNFKENGEYKKEFFHNLIFQILKRVKEG